MFRNFCPYLISLLQMNFTLTYFLILEEILTICSSFKKLLRHFKIVSISRVRKEEETHNTYKDAANTTKITQEIKHIVLVSLIYLCKLCPV